MPRCARGDLDISQSALSFVPVGPQSSRTCGLVPRAHRSTIPGLRPSPCRRRIPSSSGERDKRRRPPWLGACDPAKCSRRGSVRRHRRTSNPRPGLVVKSGHTPLPSSNRGRTCHRVPAGGVALVRCLRRIQATSDQWPTTIRSEWWHPLNLTMCGAPPNHRAMNTCFRWPLACCSSVNVRSLPHCSQKALSEVTLTILPVLHGGVDVRYLGLPRSHLQTWR